MTLSSQVGAKVKTLQVGDRVAIEPGATCLMCDACRSGSYNVRMILNLTSSLHILRYGSFAQISFSLQHPLMMAHWPVTIRPLLTMRMLFLSISHLKMEQW